MTAPPRRVPRLWAVTPPVGEPLAACVDAWPASADLGVWLRTPGASPRSVVDRCAAVVRLADAAELPIVLGCDASAIDEAAACVRAHGLAGVVLRGDPPRDALLRARDVLGDAWLGRSTHEVADDHGLVDWTVLGPIFAPHTAKPQAASPLGAAAIARARAAPRARIVAIGGVDRHTAAACLAAGAFGLAGIRSFFGAPDEVAEDVAVLHARLQTAEHGQTSS